MQNPDSRPRREKTWCGIIIHHTDIGNRKEITDDLWSRLFQGVKNWLTTKDQNYVSAHYLIGRFGEVAELVNPETHEAYHAGKSSYWHPYHRRVVPDWNRYAIGIELLGDGNLHKYSEKQYEALIKLCRELMVKFQEIHPLAIVGHENIAYPSGRKQDPGKYFDWSKLFKGIYVS